ncbi:hypothetical protein CSIM01_10841 [Colletotrichum simmondsii]|uniref:Uncharacterized protein n=1 Tax=Colletotrichum simmondsii TaxID=703756 RepID=A0A135RMQ6_9PEZI|nr:hypothetical protein CSIM01_10841 [Colletotrichum simmondsii]
MHQYICIAVTSNRNPKEVEERIPSEGPPLAFAGFRALSCHLSASAMAVSGTASGRGFSMRSMATGRGGRLISSRLQEQPPRDDKLRKMRKVIREISLEAKAVAPKFRKSQGKAKQCQKNLHRGNDVDGMREEEQAASDTS